MRKGLTARDEKKLPVTVAHREVFRTCDQAVFRPVMVLDSALTSDFLSGRFLKFVTLI